MLADPFSPFLSLGSARICSPEPRLAAPPSRAPSATPTRRASPAIEFTASRARFPTQSRAKPSPERPFPVCSGEPPPSLARHRPPCAAAARPVSPWPSDLNRTAQIRLDPGQPNPIPVNPRTFYKRDPRFIQNQPAVLLCSKIFLFKSFYLQKEP